ncbi:MAG: PBP1A family penicillin-binding protein [Gemmatimonadota bacterium]|nr:MAG: PBP1A family penicillin-binding protein [Gemmatimonadota bacterium]
MLGGVLVHLQRDLPSLAQLESYRPSLITRIYSSDNQILKEFYVQRRVLVPLEKIPPQLIQAVIDMEDRRFWNHWGISLRDIARALWIDLKAMRKVQGASTLTQQLARNLFLTLEQTMTRKMREMLVAVRIEKTYSKEEILEMYLNQQYLGHGAYGVQSAAQLYFSKNVEELGLAECALIAGMLKAPHHYSPLDHPLRAQSRRNLVLDAMVRCGDISSSEADSIKKTPVQLDPHGGLEGEAPYFVEDVRRQLEDKFGSDLLYQEGVSIYTSLDLRHQRLANQAIQNRLTSLQQRIDLLAQSESDTEVPAEGDTIAPGIVQGALLAIEPRSGHIKAMVGGRDFKESQWNRTVQARRQPGSAFKPFIYTAAIDNGYTTITEMLDQPIVLMGGDGKEWRPRNYDRTFGGLTTLRDGIRRSRNLVTVRLLQKIGPQQAVFYAHRMGIQSPISPVPSLALGTEVVTLLELVSAYAVLSNGGIWVRPVSILRVIDRHGEEPDAYRRVLEQERREREVLNVKTAYIMTNLLQSVIDRGTGINARYGGFRLPAAGKTGTTDDFTDAWFLGFTPEIVTGVWVGFDDPQHSLGDGQSGAISALPAWTEFMKGLQDSLLLTHQEFDVPDGIVKAKICAESKHLATPYCPELMNNGKEEVFIEGTEPTEPCPIHTTLVEGGSEEKKKKERKKRERFHF